MSVQCFNTRSSLTRAAITEQGQRNGVNYIKYADESIYEGEIEDNQPHGNGTMTYRNGDVHVGIWTKQSRTMVQGEVRFANGIVGEVLYVNGEDINDGYYEGQLKNGKPNGWGRLEWVNGFVYEGEWVDGFIIKGKMTTPDGYETYEGEFEDGEPNGNGEWIDNYCAVDQENEILSASLPNNPPLDLDNEDWGDCDDF